MKTTMSRCTGSYGRARSSEEYASRSASGLRPVSRTALWLRKPAFGLNDSSRRPARPYVIRRRRRSTPPALHPLRSLPDLLAQPGTASVTRLRRLGHLGRLGPLTFCALPWAVRATGGGGAGAAWGTDRFDCLLWHRIAHPPCTYPPNATAGTDPGRPRKSRIKTGIGRDRNFSSNHAWRWGTRPLYP